MVRGLRMAGGEFPHIMGSFITSQNVSLFDSWESKGAPALACHRKQTWHRGGGLRPLDSYIHLLREKEKHMETNGGNSAGSSLQCVAVFVVPISPPAIFWPCCFFLYEHFLSFLHDLCSKKKQGKFQK